MNSKKAVQVFLILLGISLGFLGYAEGRGQGRFMKKGILLAAFGSTVERARISFQKIDQRVQAAFPGVPVRWAYTSHRIRKKMAQRGKVLDSVELALARMRDEGFTRVAVQSLHTIAGLEFHDLVANAKAFEDLAGGFERIVIGYPLLGGPDDMDRVSVALIRNIPGERGPGDAVVFMGHGTHHPSNAAYAALMYHLQKRDPNIFVATVEGSPDIHEISQALIRREIRKAYLMPFMSVAGDHARNDMAGDEKDSWKNILARKGIACVPVLKGTAESDNIVDIWIDHLREAYSGLK